MVSCHLLTSQVEKVQTPSKTWQSASESYLKRPSTASTGPNQYTFYKSQSHFVAFRAPLEYPEADHNKQTSEVATPSIPHFLLCFITTKASSDTPKSHQGICCSFGSRPHTILRRSTSRPQSSSLTYSSNVLILFGATSQSYCGHRFGTSKY